MEKGKIDKMNRIYWEAWGRDDSDGVLIADWFDSLSDEDKKQAIELINLILNSEADPLDEDAAMITRAVLQNGYRKIV